MKLSTITPRNADAADLARSALSGTPGVGHHASDPQHPFYRSARSRRFRSISAWYSSSLIAPAARSLLGGSRHGCSSWSSVAACPPPRCTQSHPRTCPNHPTADPIHHQNPLLNPISIPTTPMFFFYAPHPLTPLPNAPPARLSAVASPPADTAASSRHRTRVPVRISAAHRTVQCASGGAAPRL